MTGRDRTDAFKTRALRTAARAVYRARLFRALTGASTRFEAARSADGSGIGFPYIRRRRARCLPILTYHRVTPEPDEYLPAMPLSLFEQQMECLVRFFTVLPLEQALDGLERGELPDDAVVVTFDDGYADNFEFAFPVLRDLGLTATIFLVSGMIGTPSALWYDRVFRAVNRTTERVLPAFGPDRRDYRLDPPGARATTLADVLRWLRSLHPPERTAAIDDLVARLKPSGGRPDTSPLMLDWDAVETMHRAGISFGAHTVSHPILSRIPETEALEEIGRSRTEIEARIGGPVRSFAYPNGRAEDFNPAVQRLVRDSGLRCAVTTIPGTNRCRPGDAVDAYALRRLAAEDVDGATFGAKLNLSRFAET